MKRFIIFFICLILLSLVLHIKEGKTIDIHKDEIKIVGDVFSPLENQYIYIATKKFIQMNEGVKLKAYHLKDEYQFFNGKPVYDIIKKKIGIITIETKKMKPLYTACYGNTMIHDSKGSFVRFIKPQETFTRAQCDTMFAEQYNYYIKQLYRNFTIKGVNYFNKMMLNEVVLMMDIIWHNGATGSKKTCNAMVNFVKFRTKAGFRRLLKSIDKDLKQSAKYNNFKTRRDRYKKLLTGELVLV